jgi:dienelactone hydrolase
MSALRTVSLSLTAVGLLTVLSFQVPAAEPPGTGFFPEVTVADPTRLAWDFAAASFGPDAVKLKDYDSRRQRYQLFVPAKYDKARSWPLIVFISPGDDPFGWRYWQKVCEEGSILFCAAYGAGNNTPPGLRTRIVLDMLDDVRRHYRIDPDETYLTGFSGGGRMACALAFALPEYFGGVVPICGTNPPHRLTYLNHRAADRLSVALVTGSGDFNRGENEDYMLPLLQASGVRTRLWVVPKLGHGVPGPDVLAEVHGWLAEDLKRRRADGKAWAGLALTPDDVPTPGQQAKAMLQAAETALSQADRTWRGVALLQGIVQRFDSTESAPQAKKLLEQIQNDPKKLALVAEQGGAEERRTLAVQGSAFEKLGDVRRAMQAYQILARNHPDAPEGKKAAGELKRLQATPFLGVAFADGLKVQQVMPKGAGDLAGLKAGDVIVKLGMQKVGSLQEFRQALQAYKAGDKTTLEVQRGGKPLTLSVEFTPLPVME